MCRYFCFITIKNIAKNNLLHSELHLKASIRMADAAEAEGSNALAEEEYIDPLTRVEELYTAVLENRFGDAVRMMDERVPPTYQDRETGRDCLYWAVKHNNVPLVRLLIERGGSVHYHESKQFEAQHSNDVDELTKKILTNSPLQIASYNGYVNIVWLLVADGFSAEDKDALGNTSVHLSASAGHAGVLRVLLNCGAQINVFNKFKNLPVDIAITKETAELLHNEIEKRQGSYDSAAARAETIRMYGRIKEELAHWTNEASKPKLITTENVDKLLEAAIDEAKRWEVDELMIEESNKILNKLLLYQDLQQLCSSITKLCPIRKQEEYIAQVNHLERAIERAESLGLDRQSVQAARDLVLRCQIDYWLNTVLAKLAGVTQAMEHHEHDINKLRNTIQKAETFGATDSLIEEASTRLRRLDLELEMSRAVGGYQKEKLPIDNPPPDYWQPCDTGHVVQTPEYPLPPESGEYIWEPSEAYTRARTTLDRLKKCIQGIDNFKINEALIAEVKDKIVKSEKDMKLLDAKDGQDKAAAIEAATKAAKKLKKKGGGKPKK